MVQVVVAVDNGFDGLPGYGLRNRLAIGAGGAWRAKGVESDDAGVAFQKDAAPHTVGDGPKPLREFLHLHVGFALQVFVGVWGSEYTGICFCHD